MADIQHSAIPEAQLHEPKGVSTASADTVYVADGSASGSWRIVPFDGLDSAALYTDIQSNLDSGAIELNGSYFITGVIPDISTVDSVLIPVPNTSVVVGASIVLGGALTVADSVISFKTAGGSSLGTQVTVPFTSSTKGDQFSFTATTNTTLTGPTYVEVSTDGGSTGTESLFITLELTTTLNG